MSRYNFEEGGYVFHEYFEERKTNFIDNFDPNDIWIFVEMAVVIAVTSTGKLTPMSPLFTAVMPMWVAISLSGVQLFVNLVFNRFFAKANVILMNL